MNCPLCLNCSTPYQTIKTKAYFECSVCGLIFLDRKFLLNESEELAVYELHQNNPDDPHYRQFLSPASEAVKKYCIKNGRGLDVGCGPGPTLSLMLNELGYAMDVYDKFFMPDQSVFTNHYDFITCTEVIEHIDQLDQFLQLLLKSLSAGGYLIFMTKIFAQDTEFKTWYYKDDPTHISFITKETVQYMASHYGLNLKELTRQLIVFQKGQ